MQIEQDILASTLVRVYLLGPLELWKKDPSGNWKRIPKDKWKNSKPTRAVFKRLLVQPGRRLARSTIEEDVWSESENFELVTKNVYNAISLIRGIIGKPLVTCWEAAYEIAGQTLVWTDLDACSALLKEAENRGQGSIQAIPLLEQAVILLERGELLEGEDGRWCYAFRKRAEDMFRQARLWLAESYETQSKRWQAGEQYRAMILSDPSNEDALQHWLEMLARHDKRQEALKCYRDMKEFVEAQGFSLSPEVEQITTSLKGQLGRRSLIPVQPIKSITGRSIIMPVYDTWREVSSPSIFLDSGLLDRLERAFTPPDKLDDIALSYLYPSIFEQKKKLVQGKGANWSELLISASNHLRLCTNFLESHSGTDQQLITIIGEICLLIGDVLFNIGNYQTAIRYYATSLRAAQESRNATLQAIVFGRYSLLLIDQQQSSQAILFMDEAIRLAESAASVICSWLWAVKGEAYANIGKEKLCLEALEASREILGRKEERETCYTFVAELAPFVYSTSKLLGYEGACYLRLKQPEQAQRVLLVSQESSSHPHHQSLVNADFAMALIQEEAPQDACVFALQALHYIQKTCSTRAFQRVLSIRKSLTSWNDLSAVKELDEQILLSRQML